MHTMSFKFVAGAALVILSLTSATTKAMPVTVGTNDWQQVDAFSGSSHDQISTVCDVMSGACTGVLAGIDLTGWTWASASDVRDLFLFLGAPLVDWVPTDEPGTWRVQSPSPSPWENNLFAAGFLPTTADSNGRFVQGWLRTVDANGTGNAYVGEWFDAALGGDIASTAGSSDPGTASSQLGGWFFQASNTVDVPAPAPLGLLVLGFFATAGIRYTRSKALL